VSEPVVDIYKNYAIMISKRSSIHKNCSTLCLFILYISF